MLNRNGKYPGFTLLEMIVAMIVGSIIITLIFGIFMNVQTTWNSFHLQQEKTTNLLFFHKAIENDLDNASLVTTSDEKVYYLYSLTDTIVYTFDSSIIRTTSNHSDTFPVIVKNIKPHYVQSLVNSGIVNEIDFDIVFPVSLKSLQYCKYYTSSDLMSLTLKTD